MVSTPLKNISQNGNLPQVWMKIKKYLKPPTRKLPNQNYPSFPKNKWRRNFRLLRHHLCSIFRPHLWRQSLLGFQPREGRRAAREMVNSCFGGSLMFPFLGGRWYVVITQLAVYTIYTPLIYLSIGWFLGDRICSIKFNQWLIDDFFLVVI